MKIEIPFMALRVLKLARPLVARHIQHNKTVLYVGAEGSDMYMVLHNYRTLAGAKWPRPEPEVGENPGDFEYAYCNVGSLVKAVINHHDGPPGHLFAVTDRMLWNGQDFYLNRMQSAPKWRPVWDQLQEPRSTLRINPTAFRRFMDVFSVHEKSDPSDGPFVELSFPAASTVAGITGVSPCIHGDVRLWGAFCPARHRDGDDYNVLGWECVYEQYKEHVVSTGLSGEPTVDILTSALKLMSVSQLRALQKELGCENH